MAKDSGSQNRKNDKSIKISSDAKEKLQHYAMSKKIPMSVIANVFIDIGTEHDIYDPDWITRFKIEQTKGAELTRLDHACPALTFTNGDFYCIWSRDGKPPTVRKLFDNLNDSLDFCKGCNETRKLRENYEGRLEDYKEQITNFESLAKNGLTLEIPNCARGAKLSDDGKKLYCPLNGAWKTVEKCNDVLGSRCKYLGFSKLRVKGILPEVKK